MCFDGPTTSSAPVHLFATFVARNACCRRERSTIRHERPRSKVQHDRSERSQYDITVSLAPVRHRIVQARWRHRITTHQQERDRSATSTYLLLKLTMFFNDESMTAALWNVAPNGRGCLRVACKLPQHSTKYYVVVALRRTGITLQLWTLRKTQMSATMMPNLSRLVPPRFAATPSAQ